MDAIIIPIKTESTLNKREHWAEKARRVEDERRIVTMFLSEHEKPDPKAGKIHLTLTRIRPTGRKALDRWDNLPASFKATIDAFCRWVGIDDGDEDAFSCEFKQEAHVGWHKINGLPVTYAIRMEWTVK